ncbi:hypothetical protein HanRHA438_Chr11g0514551 [Helianthus annuus]|nr:hypothetical protein HanRHA438_Chr11g0514551 [Helianthus annuus]
MSTSSSSWCSSSSGEGELFFVNFIMHATQMIMEEDGEAETYSQPQTRAAALSRD